MDQNNTLSLGVALSSDKRRIPKLRGNAVQSLGKGKGREEVQEQKPNSRFFSALAFVSFGIYADYVSGRLVDTI